MYGYKTSFKLNAEKHKVPLTSSISPFGTQGSGELSQIFTILRQNGNDIQDAEPDELPAIMSTIIKLQ
ncbi:MAG: hypothetical protein EZS28_049052 [Streblomastix strix]|uniref:Uncharacterized protein n=1 Tax=Streblomastix strix TaxID=222440 RepID=A0A5J4TCN6_9EUKA|nr:MAG: hypothetical protein EZS28_049052 [Streblomastix strix]